MRRLLYVAALAMLTMLVLAPAALAQNQFNCPDFQFREDAQAVFDADPSDPNELDEDPGPDDGMACETLPSRGEQSPAQQPQSQEPPAEPSAAPQQSETTSPQLMESGGNLPLPATGGVTPLLPAGALLVGSGLLALGILRRS